MTVKRGGPEATDLDIRDSIAESSEKDLQGIHVEPLEREIPWVDSTVDMISWIGETESGPSRFPGRVLPFMRVLWRMAGKQ